MKVRVYHYNNETFKVYPMSQRSRSANELTIEVPEAVAGAWFAIQAAHQAMQEELGREFQRQIEEERLQQGLQDPNFNDH